MLAIRRQAIAWGLAAATALIGSAAAQGKVATRAVALRKNSKALAMFDVPPEASARLQSDRIPVRRHANAEALGAYVAGRTRTNPKGIVEVDREGEGARWTALDPTELNVLSWFHGGRFCDLGFYFRGKDWWVCSAEIFEGKLGDLVVQLWDADANGAPGEFHDYVRWGKGVWHANAGVRLVDDGSTFGEGGLVRGKAVPTFEFTSGKRADFCDDFQWTAVRIANRMRNLHGFAPAEPWLEGCKWLKKHTDFQQLNDPKNTNKLHPNMGERADLPGYTKEADEMSQRGSIACFGPGQGTEGHVANTLLVTQTRKEVFAVGAAKFGYGRTANWSMLRGEEGKQPWGQRCAVLPGAGATDVPVNCGGVWPTPRSFPDLYKTPRGLPISLQLDPDALGPGRRMRARSIALLEGANLAEVAGFSFSIRDVAEGAPENDFFFVPGSPLKSDTVYTAQALIEATIEDRNGKTASFDIELLQWQFRTAKP